MSYLTMRELKAIGFRSLGRGVLLSKKCSLFGASLIDLGDYSRIDDFCILSAGSGGITIGRNVHIACYSSLIGAGAIVIDDFANISSRVAVYSSNDDYSGDYMTNPTVPSEFTNVTHGPVVIEKHVIVGAGSVILPNVRIGICSAIGALSLVKSNCPAFGLYAGVPAKFIRNRPRTVLDLEEAFLGADAP